jgi:hypothetical protein
VSVIAERTPAATDPRILDNNFPDSDTGLQPPRRRTVLTAPGANPVARSGGNTLQTAWPALQIANLDRQDPPGYRAGGMPRAPAFNQNVLAITGTPAMPPIAVRCTLRGFSPRQTPIHWRLQCRHVLARHINTGNSRYSGRSEIHQLEWQGRSTAADFTLFAGTRDPTVSYDYNSPANLMGGHALLTVAARPPGSSAWLLDYVHLRIGGSNPQQRDVVDHLDRVLAGRNENILTMVRAVFAHESDYTQFRTHAQTGTSYRGVRFDWPDDPPNFPLATFDFGVGISQYTRLPNRPIVREVAWDWRENIRNGLNLFLTSNLRGEYSAGMTWREWARHAWARYNGGGADARVYAARLAASPIGQEVSNSPVPSRIDLMRETAHIPGPAALAAPPAWPPQPAPAR